MVLQIVNGDFSVYKVKEISEKLLKNKFTFTGTTDNELSVISESRFVPEDALKVEKDWKRLRIAQVIQALKDNGCTFV